MSCVVCDECWLNEISIKIFGELLGKSMQLGPYLYNYGVIYFVMCDNDIVVMLENEPYFVQVTTEFFTSDIVSFIIVTYFKILQ